VARPRTDYSGSNNPNYRGGFLKKCVICGQQFWVIPSDIEYRKTCSKKCMAILQSLKYSKNHPKGFLGKHHTLETINKIKAKLKGKRPHDKYDAVSRKLRENNPAKRPEVKEKIRTARKKQRIPTFLTAPERRIIETIERYKLPFRYVGNGSFWIGALNPDFIHISEKSAVDVFGDYWHRGNVPYYETEFGRKEYFKRHGWDLLILWESELETLSELEICRRLLNAQTLRNLQILS